MYYRLEILNSLGVVYDSYEGREKATLEIKNYEGLDKIIFKYYDCASYLDEVKVFESYVMEGCDFGYHVLDVSEEDITIKKSIDAIKISGKQNNIDTSKHIMASFNEYNLENECIRENEEVQVNFSNDDNTFEILFDVSYGISKFDYVIYFYDELGNKINVYSSGIKEYSLSQEFVGTLNCIKPNESTINVNILNVTITLDTGFTSIYDFMFYEIEVYSSSDDLLDSYSGNSPSVTLNFIDNDGKLSFYYKYSKCAYFLGEKIVYETISTSIYDLEDFYFGIDEESFSHICDISSITIEGKMHGYDLYNGDLYIYISEYNEANEAIRLDVESLLVVNASDESFETTFNVSYGIKSFDYYICYVKDDLVELYRSRTIEYTGNQSFDASFDRIEPKDAEITYLDEGISIGIDSKFTSEHSNLFYKVEVLNSVGDSYAVYSGTDKALLNIISLNNLDKIFFRYTTCGTFNEEIHEYDSYLTSGIVFSYPTLTFDESLSFERTSFKLGYEVNMEYDYTLASINLIVSKDGFEQKNLVVTPIENKGKIDLEICDALGDVTISSSITFKTNEGKVYTISQEDMLYNMAYSFEITKMDVDGTDYSNNMPMTIYFNEGIPSTYKIHITDLMNGIDDLINSTDLYYRVLDKTIDYSITIQAQDDLGNNFGESKLYSISYTEAESNYVSPTMMNSPNPGDATITYNEDGTINIYREVNIEGLPENEYLNAFIYGSSTTDSETGRTIYTNAHDVITRGKYAIIENIPFDDYAFFYYVIMEYNGISYKMYREWPSGSVDILQFSATATVTKTSEKTIVSITIFNSYYVVDKISVDGVEYQYTSYIDEHNQNPELVLDGSIDINQITVYLNDYYNDYETFSNEIELKGSPEMEIKINVVSA